MMNDETALAKTDAPPLAVDPNTGEIVGTPEQRNELTTTQNEIDKMISAAGTLELTDEQKAILYADVDPEDVEIRPDGLIYLPWMEYVCRLRDALGGEWAMIPDGKPQVQNNLIIWGFHMVIRGKLMGYALGQQEYYSNNPTMTWGDACEGAKSNALMRLCKGLGISIELWRPSFVRKWKAQYAESYVYYNKRKNRNETRWRKKTDADAGHTQDAPPSREPQPPTQAQPPGDATGPAPNCPQCGSVMRVRKRRDGSGSFWGCSNYPDCKGIVNMEDAAEGWGGESTTGSGTDKDLARIGANFKRKREKALRDLGEDIPETNDPARQKFVDDQRETFKRFCEAVVKHDINEPTDLSTAEMDVLYTLVKSGEGIDWATGQFVGVDGPPDDPPEGFDF